MNAYQNKNIFSVARRNYWHKIKSQVYVHVFTSISVLQNIIIIFHDFPGLESGLTKFRDFPGRVVTLKI